MAAPASAEAPRDIKPQSDDERVLSQTERRDAITRAQIWRRPHVPVAEAYLGQPGDAPAALACTFTLGRLGGTAPKFDCALDTGESVRIKYGKGAEIPAETAATRLLRALGFGADHVTLVPRLRCYGCPRDPFAIVKVVQAVNVATAYERLIDYSAFEDFEWVSLERKFDARPIETAKEEGWGFFELDAVSEQAPCAKPLLLSQDVGATFGPRKVDLDGWAGSTLWEDRASCRVSMRHMPYGGATFGQAEIGEGGRRFLAALLEQLSDRQLADLFAGARFDQPRRLFGGHRPVADWVRVFKARVRGVSDGPACPR